MRPEYLESVLSACLKTADIVGVKSLLKELKRDLKIDERSLLIDSAISYDVASSCTFHYLLEAGVSIDTQNRYIKYCISSGFEPRFSRELTDSEIKHFIDVLIDEKKYFDKIYEFLKKKDFLSDLYSERIFKAAIRKGSYRFLKSFVLLENKKLSNDDLKILLEKNVENLNLNIAKEIAAELNEELTDEHYKKMENLSIKNGLPFLLIKLADYFNKKLDLYDIDLAIMNSARGYLMNLKAEDLIKYNSSDEFLSYIRIRYVKHGAYECVEKLELEKDILITIDEYETIISACLSKNWIERAKKAAQKINRELSEKDYQIAYDYLISIGDFKAEELHKKIGKKSFSEDDLNTILKYHLGRKDLYKSYQVSILLNRELTKQEIDSCLSLKKYK